MYHEVEETELGRPGLAYLARRLLNVPELEDHGDEEAGDEAGEGQRQADLAEKSERQHEPHLHGPVRRSAAVGGRRLAAVVGEVRCRRRRRRRLLRILGWDRMRMTLSLHSQLFTASLSFP